MIRDFLPISKADMKKRGWDQCDFIVVTGDAYVDHPSFGTAIISRVLEKHGYKVGIISQPDWRELKDFKRLGQPRLGFLVNSGNIDSMVNHYTVAKKRRNQDHYSPGGRGGLRPDRAVSVYSNKLREAYKDTSIIIGGIEASLRRFAHYDYWDDKVRRSVLMDSSADLLIYGMGERPVVELAENLDGGIPIEYINYVNGTVFKTKEKEMLINDYIEMDSYDEVKDDKESYAKAARIQYQEQDAIRGKTLVQRHGNVYIVQNPPSKPLTTLEFDDVYDLPYMKDFHPVYKNQGGIPAIREVKFSLVSERGCYGACSFCAITFHQGRVIQTRSHESLIKEGEELINDKDFKGYIHDVGGPTANFRGMACEKQKRLGTCKDRQCLYPTPCKNLKIDHKDYTSLLRKLRSINGVKKVFVRSGLRYDYIMADSKRNKFMEELCEHHVSGQLKVAPEHISQNVLDKMGKPGGEIFTRFQDEYRCMNKKLGKDQYLVPYLMSSHPGSNLEDAVELAEYLRDTGLYPEQVQDFYPTPGTISTAMYHTGIDPRTMKKVYVPKDRREKAVQRALLQFKNPANAQLVYEGLKKANRMDLVGYEKECLIRPHAARMANKENPDSRGDSDRKNNSKKKEFGKKGKRPRMKSKKA